ncbi:hypothetical protein [Acidocella sp.]|uniref:hypothetical protein n=1 Tax=Acidocella sp. TaxID=50710 RepID=UPI00262A5959|nr:hypothetical protein [Acidocella sp.]
MAEPGHIAGFGNKKIQVSLLRHIPGLKAKALRRVKEKLTANSKKLLISFLPPPFSAF